MEADRPNNQLPDTPGAPQMDASVKPPVHPEHDEAPIQPEPTGPAFRPMPTDNAGSSASQPEPVSAQSNPVPVTAATQPSPGAQDRQARTDYLRQVNRNRSKKSHTVRNVIIIVVILLLIGAGAAYWFWWRPAHQPVQPKPQPQPTTQSQPQTQPTQPTGGALGANGQTKEYNSSNFSLTLDYPASWTPQETNGILTVTSPVVPLTDASGNDVKGRVVLTIQPPKQADLKPFDQGKVVAVIKSDRVTYTNPSTSQNGASYLSFLQYPSTTTKGGLDAMYLTGNSGYQYGGVVNKSDITGVDPLVGITFIGCANDDCPESTQTQQTISSDMWKQADFRQPIVKMIESFHFE